MKRMFLFLFMSLFLLSFASASLMDGLLSYYQLDESSGAVIDIHGNNNATNTGAIAGITGKIGTAYNLSSTDHIATDSNTGLSGSTSRSVSMWLYNTDFTLLNHQCFGSMGTNTAGNLWRMQISNGNIIWWSCWGGGCDWDTGIGFPLSQWNHLVFTYNGTDLALYLNGALQITRTQAMNTTNSAFWIGDDLTGEANGWRGLIDEVALYNRTLNSTEVLESYNNNSGLTYDFTTPLVCSVLSSGNYTITDGYLIADPSSAYLYSNVSLNYSYSAVENSPAGDIIEDTSLSIASVVVWFPIVIVLSVMVVLVLLTVLIIQTIKGSGLMESA